MSILEALNKFGKGIALSCGFDVGAKALLDSREIVANLAELDSIPDIRRADGLKVWVKSEKTLMVWDDTDKIWVPASGDTNLGQFQRFLDGWNDEAGTEYKV